MPQYIYPAYLQNYRGNKKKKKNGDSVKTRQLYVAIARDPVALRILGFCFHREDVLKIIFVKENLHSYIIILGSYYNHMSITALFIHLSMLSLLNNCLSNQCPLYPVASCMGSKVTALLLSGKKHLKVG